MESPFPSDFTLQALAAQLSQALAACHVQFPQADPQFTVAQAAKILGLAHEPTVREYFKLPVGHRRRLPYVDTNGAARGYRVRLSDLTAWQQRNCSDAVPVEIPVRRSARRAG